MVAGAGLVTLVEIRFAGGTRYYSFQGVSTPNQWWADTVISIGDITTEVPILPGEYRVSDTTVVLDNTSLEFSRLKDTETFRNVRVAIRHGDAALGQGGLLIVFTGEISDWRFYGNRLELMIRDVSFERFREKVQGTFRRTEFPYCPGDNLGRLIPIIYGHLEGPEPIAGKGRGAIPAYLVDPHQGESFYTYVLARHPCARILDVYNYERLMGAGDYQISTRQYGDYHCQIMRFQQDIRDSSQSGPEISFNAQGLTETGGSAGVLIQNPISQLAHYLTNWAGVDAHEIDQPSFYRCRQAFGFVGGFPPPTGVGGWALIDENDTHADVIEKHSDSFGSYFSVNRFGKFSVYILELDNALPATDISSFSDSAHVLADTFEIQSIPDPVTRLQYNYRYIWSMDYFYRQPDDNLPEEQAKLGREVRDSFNLWYVVDDYTAASVASKRHQYMRENTQTVRFALPPEYFALNVNDHIKLTHWQGIAAAGNGYVDQRIRITGLNHSFEPTAMRVHVQGICLPEAIAVVVPTFAPAQEALMVGPALSVAGF